MYSLGLSTTSNWNQIYSEFREAISNSNLGYTPIPAFEVPITLSTPAIAIQVTSTKAKGWWRSAGFLYQRFQLGSTGTANPLPSVDAKSIFIEIGRPRLIIFDSYQPEYSLIHVCPYWFEDCRVVIWEYVGDVGFVLDGKFAELQSDLERIEQKIDSLI